MRDEIDMRLIEEHGPALNQAIWYWIHEVSAALTKLNERTYAAPWLEEQARADCRSAV